MNGRLRLIGSCALVALAGCTRTVVREGTKPPVHVPTENTSIRYNNASIVDLSIGNKIAVEASNWSRTATGTASVWVQLRNRTDHPLAVECRTQFFDVNGGPIEGPTAWQRVILGPNTTSPYRENSARTDVQYYYVEIREGR